MNNQDNEQEFDPFADTRGQRGPAGGALAWLALLLVLALGAREGWQWWQSRQAPAQAELQSRQLAGLNAAQTELSRRLDAYQERLAELEKPDRDARFAGLSADLARLESQVADAAREAGDARRQLEDVRVMQESLGERVTALEAGMAALAARGESPARRVELAEVEFLLRMASERLQLFGDVRGAGRALALADRQLEALDDPLYLPVRQDIAAARRALSAVPRVDVVALATGLSGLQSEIGDLPFPGDRAPSAQGAPTGEVRDGQTGIWARLKSAMASLVTVRRKVQEESLLSLEDRDFLRQGLWLQLESARLALMRRDTEAWRQSLERAGSTVSEYFDRDRAAVRRFTDELERLSEAGLEVDLPDISTPWARLNLLRTGREAGPTAAPSNTEQPPPQPGEEDG